MDNPEDFSVLTTRARRGDADAQYALAIALKHAGMTDDADHWLRTSAHNGCANAIYTLATRDIATGDGAAAAAPKLEQAAARGSTAAARLLATLRSLALAPRPSGYDGLAETVLLARNGDATASAEIACLLAQIDLANASIAALLSEACKSEPVAAAFCLARAAQGRQAGSEDLLNDCAALLGKSRYPRLAFLKAALGESRPPLSPPHSVDWDSLVAQLKRAPAPAPAADRLSDYPDVVLHRGAVAPEICEYVIAHAASRLGPSLVYDPKAERMIRDPLRTSATACLSPVNLDLALIALNRLIARVADCNDENGEFLSVLRYAPGQEYRPHFDCIPAGRDREENGQRVKTALLFLNDDYEGGETHFLSPGLKIKGRRGDVLVFSNVLPDGAPDRASRHAGLPVKTGEKWLASRWFRDRKFKF